MNFQGFQCILAPCRTCSLLSHLAPLRRVTQSIRNWEDSVILTQQTKQIDRENTSLRKRLIILCKEKQHGTMRGTIPIVLGNQHGWKYTYTKWQCPILQRQAIDDAVCAESGSLHFVLEIADVFSNSSAAFRRLLCAHLPSHEYVDPHNWQLQKIEIRLSSKYKKLIN